MTDDQQRARELRKQAAEILAAAYKDAHFFGAMDDALSETPSPHCQVTITAITAALRAAPEGPATHYHCKDGIHGTVRRLRRYSTTANNRNSLQGQTMEEAAAFIEHVLAARPKGVKDGMITRVLMLANRWDEVAKTAPSQSGLMNEMARELRAVLHDDRDSVGADNA